MVAVVVAAVAGAVLLLWRGEGLAGVFLLAALAAVLLVQLDARRRLSDLAADLRRHRAELRTLAARTANQETELQNLTHQITRTTRAIGQAREDITDVGDRVRDLDAALRDRRPPPPA